MQLPIDAKRDAVLAAVEAGRPVVVEAPTGSGKSTRLGVWLAEQVSGPVLVVEPRRVAARSLARFVAEQRSEPVGRSVGYRVRFDDKTGRDTRVIYATPGVALRMLRPGGRAWPAAVVLDEFHERGWETDLCAALLLDARQRGAWSGPLVFTSATLAGQELTSTLGGERVITEGRTYPVEVRYEERPGAPSSRDLEQRVADAVLRLAKERPEGDLLVFLPGKGEIGRCRRELEHRPDVGRLELVPLHAGLKAEAVDKAFTPPRGQRRVFLATNVAETSVTLPWVRTVVDSGLVRQQIHRGGRSALALVPTSRASMDQRTGRAGRTAPGFGLRLFSNTFRPEGTTKPELERVDLDDLVVQAAACGLDGPALPAAPWPTPPPAFALDEARARLARWGALDEEGRLTERGRHLADLPVSARVARALLRAPDEVAGAAADVVALAERDRDLLVPLDAIPPSRREDVQLARIELLGTATSDVEVQLRCLRAGDARTHGLHEAGLSEARRTARLLREVSGAKPATPEADARARLDLEALARHLLERLPEQAYVLRPRAHKKPKGKARGRLGPADLPWANGAEELMVRPFEPVSDERGPPSTEKGPQAGLILASAWIGAEKGRGVRGHGRLLLPCQLRWLAEAGLGEERVGRSKLLKGRSGPRLVATVERVLADVVLGTVETPLQGEALLEEAGRLVEQGRLLPPAGEELADALHLVTIARTLGLSDVEPPAGSAAALARDKLATLGVTSGEDLALVEPADLSVDLVELLGLDPLDVEKLAADFPRLWSFEGVVHRVHLEPHPRRVVLEVEQGSDAKIKPPPARLAPRFRGLPVAWRKASRTLPLR